MAAQLTLSASESASPSSSFATVNSWRQSWFFFGRTILQPVSRRSSSDGVILPAPPNTYVIQ